MLKLTCGPKMAAIPNLDALVWNFVFVFFSRGVCRRCWRGQVLMDRLIKGRVFYLYKWFATMDQPKKTRHVINDIQHASICLMAGLQIIPRDGSASRPKSLDGVGIVYSSCGVDTVSNFNLCIMCMYIYIYTMLYYIGMIQDLITFKNTIKQAYLKSARGNGQHSFKRVHSGHLDADICVSVEPQQVLDRCTAWRMWPIAIARKRRRSSFTLKLN